MSCKVMPGLGSAAGMEEDGVFVTEPKSSAPNVVLCVSASARRIKFSSSRTFPGQSCCSRGPRANPVDNVKTSALRFRFVLAQKIVRQFGDILAPFLQRRNRKRNYVQSVVEIGAELPLFDHLRQ